MDRSRVWSSARLPGVVAVLLLTALAWWWRAKPQPDSVGATPSDDPDSFVAAEDDAQKERSHRAGLRGKVTSADDTPILGAQVCAHAMRADMLDSPPHCAKTGSDGRYVLGELRSGAYSVRASAPDYASKEADRAPLVLTDQTREVNFALELAIANVRGVVRDALGGAVGGATVRLASAVPPARAAATVTDEEGRFALHFPEGPVMVSASAEGYAADELISVVPAARMELMLTPAGSISGIVQTPTGKPAPNVEVRSAHDGVLNARSRLLAISDRAGHFSLEGLAPGAYRLIAKSAHAQGSAQETVHVGLAEAVRDVVITVQPASRVLGRVQNKETGEPCSQGMVMLTGMPDPLQSFPPEFMAAGGRPAPVPTQVANIEGDGAVEFPGVPTGTYYAVVRCEGNRLVDGPRQVKVEAKPVDVGPIDWLVMPAAILAVKTVDERGAPVGQQPLRLRVPPPAPGLGKGLLQMVTDAKGTVSVPDLRAGSYVIGPVDGRLGKNVEFEIDPKQLQPEVTLVLRGTADLTVTVRDSSGQPLEGLYVTATPATPEADQPSAPQYAASLGEGRYRIQPLPANTYRVEASDGINPASASGDARVIAGQHAELTLEVDRGAKITGRVTQPDGEPATEVWVSARAKASSTGALRGGQSKRNRILTDDRGAFVLEGLSRGAVYTVSAQEPYGSETSIDNVAADSTVTLKMPPTGRLAGRLQTVDGKPARVHLARATSIDGRVERVADVSADGTSFAIKGIPAGEVRLLVANEKGEVATANVNVQAGDRATFVELALMDDRPSGVQPDPRRNPLTQTPARAD